jgi:hypothetical protein
MTLLLATTIISARIPFRPRSRTLLLIPDFKERDGSSDVTAALLETGERRSCQVEAKLGYRRPSLEMAGYWYAGQYRMHNEADSDCNRQYCRVLVVIAFGPNVLLRLRVR